MATAANTPACALKEVFVTMSKEAASSPWVSMATGVPKVGKMPQCAVSTVSEYKLIRI